MKSDFFDTTIGEQLTLQRGFDITKKQQIPGDVPVVSSGGIASYHNEAKVEGPGVVLGRKGTLGTVFFIEEDYWPHDTSLWVKDFKGNNPRFVYYFFKSITAIIKKMDVGAANPALNRNHVHPMEVKWPVREVQDYIVEVLAKLDDKIEVNSQTNQTLEQIAQAIFKSWFVDFEPTRAKIVAKDLGGNEQAQELAAQAIICGALTLDQLAAIEPSPSPIEKALEQTLHNHITNKFANKPGGLDPWQPEQLAATAKLFPNALVESELGEIPEGWSWSEIGKEVSVLGGGTPSTKKEEFWVGGHINWTSPKDMSNLTDKILLETDRKITEAGLAKISSGLLPENTVLMSSRAPVGYLAISKIPVAVNQGYIAMKCEFRLSPEYVVQWADSVMEDIKQRASGTTFAEISKKNFKIIPVVVPESELVSEYSRIASNLYEKITESLREEKILSQMRDSLLPKLISGEME
ncbi:restriction endonuclease subunit S [Marinagarivorans cellulosilyticus]|uniref:Type I restriction enzyme, S subunit n=1 Tax=Marinagarivorans cellulosilyticus TaxID=2721545 RepID=A0AAN1WET0_9GAMM|nr:restriction endonuclease subunit S [Marinagarivorans cellulosilyticus]BCD96268.1 type I restriction enzyme, S subunit [Marinagarivorans cellulosilyticus]